jgi:hypothetical protein
MANKLLSNLNLSVGEVVSASLELQTRVDTATGLRAQLVFFDGTDTPIATFDGNNIDDFDDYQVSPDVSGPWFKSKIEGVVIPAGAVSLNLGYAYDSANAGTVIASRKPVLNRGTKVAPYIRPSNDLSGTTVSNIGIENLISPGADRILFWDQSYGATDWLDYDSNDFVISGKTLKSAHPFYISSTDPGAVPDGSLWFDTASNPTIDADTLDGLDSTAFAQLSGANFTGSLTVNGNQVWHAGNDGPGSGLDADTLDGFHASSFALSSHGHDTLADDYLTNHRAYTNNDFKAAGFQVNHLDYSSAVKPSGVVDGYVFTLNYDSSLWAGQGFFDPRNNSMWIRCQNNGTWQPWEKVWHSGNDGAGSGLDADLLDGYHASAFAKLSGATFTGAITVQAGGDSVINLRVPDGDPNDWNYISFFGRDGVRDCYIGTDGSGVPLWNRDSNGVGVSLRSYLRVNTASGYVDIGAGDSTYCHFLTDRPEFYFNKRVQADGGFKVYSDLRMKTNVRSFARPEVANLRLSIFDWKDPGREKDQIGYIAQEVQEVLPEAVSEGVDGMLSVDIDAVLAAKVEALEAKVRELEALIEELKA